MMKIVAMAAVAVTSVAAAAGVDDADKSLAELVREDLAKPVRPGGVDGQPFWNANAVWFMYPPSFDFPVVKGTKEYTFVVFASNGAVHRFTADTPTATLAPVWDKLPSGKTDVWCEADVFKRSFRSFYKMPPYEPYGYKPSPRSYADAVTLGYDYLLKLPALVKLAATGEPDADYFLNCYPSKMDESVIRAMVKCAKRDPLRRERAVKLATAAGDYLLKIAQPDGSPLAGFTPTYEGTNRTARRYAGQNMLEYPCRAGLAFLQLHELTGAKKYLEGAEKIAATYLRLQGADGTWYLKLWEKDGKPVNPNRLLPLGVIDFMDALYAVTKRPEYRASADRAFAFVERGPLADWNWEGQFEDIEPKGRFVNLSKHPACDAAIRLVTRWPNDARRLAQAREILRFAEDQFVCWRYPTQGASLDQYVCDAEPARYLHIAPDWLVEPGVVEQYDYRENIDASLAKMIRTYLALYRATGNPLDLAKARTLGDSLVRAQQPSGRIPTILTKDGLADTQEDWINCMIASFDALEELAALAKVGADDANAEILWTRPICKEKDCYIGWPTVCRRANGELVAAFSGDREWHICPFGKVQLVRSTDDGETWSAPETIRNSRIDDRDAGIIELKDGSLVVFSFTSLAFHDAFRYKPYDRIWPKLRSEEMAEDIGYWSLRSADGGKTWEKPVRMFGSAPHGGIQLKDGRLLMVGRRHNIEGNALPGSSQKYEAELTVETSSDGGRSWRTIAHFAPETPFKMSDMHEPHVVELDDGTLVTQIRHHGKGAVGTLQSESKDGGKTWSEIHETGIPGFPAHLIKCRDGRLLSSYARRDAGHCGEYAVFSSDGGKTWDHDRTVTVCRYKDGDLGYPSTAELPDGSFLTVYYQPEQTGEKPCLMATKWRRK